MQVQVLAPSSCCPERRVNGYFTRSFLPESEAAPRRGITAASVPEISAFSQVMEAPKRLLSESSESQTLLA